MPVRARTEEAMHRFENIAQRADWMLLAASDALAQTPELPEGEAGADLLATYAQLRAVAARARALWRAVLRDDTDTGHLLDSVVDLEFIEMQLDELDIARGSPLAGPRDAVAGALAAVEAFAYLQNTYAHHATIAAHFDATIEAVLAANETQCTCWE